MQALIFLDDKFSAAFKARPVAVCSTIPDPQLQQPPESKATLKIFIFRICNPFYTPVLGFTMSRARPPPKPLGVCNEII